MTLKHALALFSLSLIAISTHATEVLPNPTPDSMPEDVKAEARSRIEALKVGDKLVAQMLDASMLELGIVNSDYEVIDEVIAKQFFDGFSQAINEGLVRANEINAQTGMIKLITYDVTERRFAFVLTPEAEPTYYPTMINYYQSDFTKTLLIDETCHFIAQSNYAQANDYKANYRLLDPDYNILFELSLDASDC